jgi:hypothetical protein
MNGSQMHDGASHNEDIVFNIPDDLSGTLTKVRTLWRKPLIFKPDDTPRFPLCRLHMYNDTDSELTTHHNVSKIDEVTQTLSSDYVNTLMDRTEI